MGDPAGIGPEILVKALAKSELKRELNPLVVGDIDFLRKTAKSLESDVEFVCYDKAVEQPTASNQILVFDLNNLQDEFPLGLESEVAGRASAEYIIAAVDLWKNGQIDAISTTPINKKALAMGGYDYPGHTEFIAELTDTKDFAMSFFAEKLCVVLLSTHVSLKDAIDLVKRDRLVKLVRFTNDKLSVLLKRRVKIAVAGLNPHASESGMFGNEEKNEISPAINECINRFDIDVCGPFSPDTVFLKGFQGEFDAVVSCYHDQATIAVKCLSFGASVNVTLGLPLVRTSVDHGTAYDIVGKNRADESSLESALKLAAKFAGIQKRF